MATSSPRDLGSYLTIQQAADVLGVSPYTLRHWDRTGKLPSIRHPINGYRLYCREDLDALLQRAEDEANQQRRSNEESRHA